MLFSLCVNKVFIYVKSIFTRKNMYFRKKYFLYVNKILADVTSTYMYDASEMTVLSDMTVMITLITVVV